MTSYLQGHHESVLRSHRWRTAANSAAYLLPHLRPGLSVLDIGCGPGTLTADLATAVAPGGQVLGVDSSPDIIEQAARDHAADGLHFAVQDVTALDLPDASYDVVHAHQVLQHLQDPVAALREMRRVARPGGLVAVRDADYAAMTWFPDSPGLEAWRATYRAVAHDLGAEPDAGRRLLSWARAAGFVEVEPTASAWCYASEEDRAWWGALSADRIVQSDVGVRAVRSGLATPEQLHEMAQAWRTWADDPDGWFAVLHGELLCRVPS